MEQSKQIERNVWMAVRDLEQTIRRIESNRWQEEEDLRTPREPAKKHESQETNAVEPEHS